MQHFAKAKYIYILSHLNDMTIQLLQYTMQYTTIRLHYVIWKQNVRVTIPLLQYTIQYTTIKLYFVIWK